MHTRSETTSPADVAGEAGSIMAGLGIITVQFFPFALPLLILAFGPLLPLALVGLVLAVPILVPIWLGRLALRALRRQRRPARAVRSRAGYGSAVGS
jgi:nitrate/nitrite transporter NarK